MKTIIYATVLCLVWPAVLLASDWRVHLAACNNNKACARDQAAAREVFEQDGWDEDLKQICKDRHTSFYVKDSDWRTAVLCLDAMQTNRNLHELQESKLRTEAAYRDILMRRQID